jgi:hypothetical protein
MATWIVHLRLADLDFLPADALRQRVVYIQEYYQKRDAWVQQANLRPYIYLSQLEMDDLIVQSSQWLFQIYTRLRLDEVPTAGVRSALQLIL